MKLQSFHTNPRALTSPQQTFSCSENWKLVLNENQFQLVQEIKKSTKVDNLNFFKIIYERLGNKKLSLESYYCRREWLWRRQCSITFNWYVPCFTYQPENRPHILSGSSVAPTTKVCTSTILLLIKEIKMCNFESRYNVVNSRTRSKEFTHTAWQHSKTSVTYLRKKSKLEVLPLI